MTGSEPVLEWSTIFKSRRNAKKTIMTAHHRTEHRGTNKVKGDHPKQYRGGDG